MTCVLLGRLGVLQRVGHWWAGQHVYGQPVLLHRQGPVRGHLEPGGGGGGGGQPAVLVIKH